MPSGKHTGLFVLSLYHTVLSKNVAQSVGGDELTGYVRLHMVR